MRIGVWQVQVYMYAACMDEWDGDQCLWLGFQGWVGSRYHVALDDLEDRIKMVSSSIEFTTIYYLSTLQFEYIMKCVIVGHLITDFTCIWNNVYQYESRRYITIKIND